MKVKPFYIRITDDMTPQMVQDAFDKCVDAGAVAYESIEMTQRKHSYHAEYSINFNYFGIAEEETFLAETGEEFGIEAQGITLDRLDEWLGIGQTETPEEKEALDMIDTTSKQVEKPNSGQDVYIAQINTLAGVESQRYFIHQYWCDSEHQNQLLKLGILFTDMDKAILKTKSLLGIPHETPEQKVERERLEAAYDLYCEFTNSNSIDSTCMSAFVFGNSPCLLKWLSIVDKTGYRKAK
ncbi:hypothetical protein [Shewanella chilikensis]|uniref:hypothetical protein n=1 Tax=Shewanella chilikensis TaxID=558541 RepID=UPI003A97A36A